MVTASRLRFEKGSATRLWSSAWGDEHRITFVDGDPDPAGIQSRPVVRVSPTYISGAAPWEQRSDLREVIKLARDGRVQALTRPTWTDEENPAGKQGRDCGVAARLASCPPVS